MDTSIVDEASSPSSSSCSSNDEMYDVFLSFSGVDTRKTFTDHLYWTLKDARVDVLIAENKLRGPELMQAIEQSRITVIIFSREYAFSIGCLEELEKIMECRRTPGQMVLPIFYHVDPIDVRKQTGRFADAFQRHEVLFQKDTDKEEKVRSWRKSLTEAANLSGLVFTNSDGYEGMFIRKTVDEITRKLKSTCVDVATEQVELDSSMREISNDLKVQVGKDSHLQEISTHLDVGGPNDTRIRLKGPRPSPLKVNKESVKIKKPSPHVVVDHRQRVVIYTPETSTISSHDKDFIASIFNNPKHQGRGGGESQQLDKMSQFPGILSPSPATLLPIPHEFFSHDQSQNLSSPSLDCLSASPNFPPSP